MCCDVVCCFSVLFCVFRASGCVSRRAWVFVIVFLCVFCLRWCVCQCVLHRVGLCLKVVTCVCVCVDVLRVCLCG